MDNTLLPEVGSTTFWDLYDDFCHPKHLTELITNGKSSLTPQMNAIMRSAHTAGTIHRLSRPERGWRIHMAWLALRHAPIRNIHGLPVMHMHPGDVIIVAWQWDRDIPITHVPIMEHVSGYFLSGQWEEMIGLFMPLYEKKTILTCIELRTTQNAKDALGRAEEESRTWGWY